MLFLSYICCLHPCLLALFKPTWTACYTKHIPRLNALSAHVPKSLPSTGIDGDGGSGRLGSGVNSGDNLNSFLIF